MIYGFAQTSSAPVEEGRINLGGRGITVNSRYISKNGVPVIPVSGEFHFSRCSRDMWRTELEKLRRGGITAVSTYMLWIYHEEEEGRFDFTGDLDIRAFIEAAADAGLDVVLRIGPWAHGECRNGGFPDWLLKKPFKLRDNNDGYIYYARRWYEKIYEQVTGLDEHIMAIQLENELVDNSAHLLRLKELAEEVGFDAPLYTVTGWNSAYGAEIPEGEVLPVFGGYTVTPWTSIDEEPQPCPHYRFDPMRNDAAIGADIISGGSADRHVLEYDRYPFATCELGGGIQVTRHRRPEVDPMDIYALSLVKLGSGNNFVGYYMYRGGTNKIGKLSTFQESTETGYPNDYPILSYDFQAPVSEYGELRRHYYLLRLLHMFIESYGSMLAPMDVYMPEKKADTGDASSLRYAARRNDKTGFIFVNHHDGEHKLDDIYGVSFEPVPDMRINVTGDICFILPFGLEIAGETLEYASVQPLTYKDGVYYFFEIPGIKPEYKFVGKDVVFEKSFKIGNAAVRTLTMEEAMRFGLDGQPPVQDAELSAEIVDGIPFDAKYIGNMKSDNIVCYRLTASKPEGFVNITMEADNFQLYSDGELAADFFSFGKAWRVPARLIYGHEAYLLVA